MVNLYCGACYAYRKQMWWAQWNKKWVYRHAKIIAEQFMSVTFEIGGVFFHSNVFAVIVSCIRSFEHKNSDSLIKCKTIDNLKCMYNFFVWLRKNLQKKIISIHHTHGRWLYVNSKTKRKNSYNNTKWDLKQKPFMRNKMKWNIYDIVIICSWSFCLISWHHIQINTIFLFIVV